jgi:tetratricopeptide (TPR) repeat protein
MTAPTALWQMYTDSGKAYFRLHQFKESENMLAAALQVAEQLGPQDPRLSLSLNNLARLRQSQKRYDESEQLFNRALTIAETERGRQHPDTAICLSNLAGLMQAQGKRAEAEAAYREAIAILEKTVGPQHETVARVRKNLAAVQKKT